MKTRFCFPLLMACLAAAAPTAVLAETKVRLVAWNIANLHHEAGVETRPRIGTKRQEGDFARLARIAESLTADIVALQEIGTPEGTERLFPSEDYAVFMSSRYDEDIEAGIDGGIYTAIAVRKGAGITVIEQDDLVDLQIDYDDEDGDASSTRRGTALHLDIDGTTLWVLSVHLKSSCATTRAADTDDKLDCQIFWRQRVPLRERIERRIDQDEAFVIAGDFNRRFRAYDFEGPFLDYIDGDDGEADVVALSQTVSRKCPTRKGRSEEPIDWFLLDADIADWYVPDSFWETRFDADDVGASGGRNSQRLSDHCPIHIDLVIP